MSMMGTPPSLISSLFWGRKRQTTLMLFPDMGESENETKKEGQRGTLPNKSKRNLTRSAHPGGD